MTPEDIKSAPRLRLKPNPYFSKVDYPFLYQKRMILLMLLSPRLLDGDDVGLGKTTEMVIAYTYMKAAKPDLKMLVMTEKVGYSEWLRVLEHLTTGLKYKLITAETHTDPVKRVRAFRQSNLDIIITNYASAYNYSHHLVEGMQPRWVYAADEPNYFKNTESQLHNRIFEMVHGPKGASRSYGLTATVIDNKLEEAFGILRIVAPGTIPDLLFFEKNFCEVARRGGRKVYLKYRNLDQFRELIKPVFYGRLQDDPEVKQELPEVITKDVEIFLGKPQSLKLLEAMDRIIEMPDGSVKQVHMLPALILAQLIANDPRLAGFEGEGEKTKALVETITNSLDGERVVVYSKFRRSIDLLEEIFREKKIDLVRITGKESTNQRLEAETRFMSDGRDRVNLLLMNHAGGKAINIQKGNHLFLYDMPWSYGRYRQVVGRLKRTGSTHKKVGVYRMQAVLHPEVELMAGTRLTIDHHNLNVVLRKFKLFQALTGDVKEITTTQGDIKEIWDEVRNSRRSL